MPKARRGALTTALEVAGIGLVVAGFALISTVLGLIVGGFALIFIGWRLA